MRVYILVCCIALTAARPEAGYSYNPPQQPLPQPLANSVSGHHAGPCCQQLALLRSNGLLSGHSGSGVSNIIVGRPAVASYPVGHSSNGFHPTHSAFGSVGGSLGHSSNGFASTAYTGGHGSSGYNGGHLSGSYNGGLVSGHTSNGFNGGHSSGLYNGGLVSGHTSSGFNGGHSSGSSYNGGLVSGHTSHGFNTGLSSGSYNGGLLTGHTSNAGLSGGFNGGHASNAFNGGSLLASGSGSAHTVHSGYQVSGGSSDASLAGSGSSSSYTTGGVQTSAPAIVQKHIYVHVPPHEPEESVESLQRAVAPALARKHYKIIFIKAPSPPSYKTAQLVSQAGLTEEKTLVYVLVKKPDEPTVQEIQAAQQDAIQHNKPEVYFIKYKTKPGDAVLGTQYSASTNSEASADTVSQGTPAPVYGPPPQASNAYLPPTRR